MASGNIEFISLGYTGNDYLCLVPEIIFDGKVQMSDYVVQGGGPAGGAANAAARLGVPTAFLGMIGDDAEGERILADFKAEGIDTSAMMIVKGGASAVAKCLITPDAKRTVVWRRHSHLYDPALLPLDMIARCRILHFDGHHTEAAIRAARAAAQYPSVLRCFDAGTVMPGVDELLKLCDVVIASEAFARTWTGEEDLDKALPRLHTGRKVTGITMGCLGSMCVSQGKVYRMPCFDPGKIVDTTGAGDSYHGAFEVKYAETGDVPLSMAFAAVFAALKCRSIGARAGQPSRAETEEALAGWDWRKLLQ